MDALTLNEILNFIKADYQAIDKLPVSGQREVFYGTHDHTGDRCIIKVCIINPINVGRIQREIRILEEMDSSYFPRFFYQTFITDSILLDFYDSFDTRDEEQKKRLDDIRAMDIKPFLITVEEYIDHIPWEDCLEDLNNEVKLVELLTHLFKALALLWGTRIAHRDLKPENILLRDDLSPVIIDLGIAKSFRPGTQDFSIVGTPCTPRYAAPEQLTNTRTDITYKTDQFSIGVISYNILTGQFPYGDVCEIDRAILEKFSREDIGNIHKYNPSVNEQLKDFVEKLLQVHPYKRFRNVQTILKRLDTIRESIA